VSLESGGGVDALWANGVSEQVVWTLIVDEPLTFFADASQFTLGPGPDVAVTFRLEPHEWFDKVEVEDLAEDGEVVFSEGDPGYELVVRQITAEEGRFESEPDDEED
jgi:hypothetical protein